jgi:hypothetical protein
MAFKMRGMSFVQGQSPMKKIGGKNYEKSKGDQQGPIQTLTRIRKVILTHIT